MPCKLQFTMLKKTFYCVENKMFYFISIRNRHNSHICLAYIRIRAFSGISYPHLYVGIASFPSEALSMQLYVYTTK